MRPLPFTMKEMLKKRRIDPNKTIDENLALRTIENIKALYEIACREDLPYTKAACERRLQAENKNRKI